MKGSADRGVIVVNMVLALVTLGVLVTMFCFRMLLK